MKRLSYILMLLSAFFCAPQARGWCDSVFQRWIQRDPIGEMGGINLYQFVGNSPINFVDPWGLDYHYVNNPTLVGVPLPTDYNPYLSGDTATESAVAAVANAGNLLGNTIVGVGNFLSWVGDQLLGDGGGQAMMMATPELGVIGDLGKAGKDAQAMQEIRDLGKAGEKAACIAKNTKRIPSVSNPGKYRVPDVLDADNKIIGEVKNVQNLSMTAQLQDYLGFAQQNGFQFQLTVDVNTYLSSSIVNNVSITVTRMPLR